MNTEECQHRQCTPNLLLSNWHEINPEYWVSVLLQVVPFSCIGQLSLLIIIFGHFGQSFKKHIDLNKRYSTERVHRVLSWAYYNYCNHIPWVPHCPTLFSFAKGRTWSRDLPTLTFKTWHFVSTRNKKSRKILVELPNLRSVALRYKIIWWQIKPQKY